MINERKLASHFSNFWRSCLPNLEAVTRSINLGYERADNAISSKSKPERRDLISETGYRLLQLRISNPSATPHAFLVPAEKAAVAFFQGNQLDGGRDLAPLNESELTECMELADWMVRFLKTNVEDGVVRVPSFRGHGILHGCQGDLAVGQTLIEVKYVDRLFRSTDFRQILAYCSLEYFQSPGATFSEIIIVNPYLGIFFSVSPAELIYSSSGRAEADFYEYFSYILSSGEISR